MADTDEVLECGVTLVQVFHSCQTRASLPVDPPVNGVVGVSDHLPQVAYFTMEEV